MALRDNLISWWSMDETSGTRNDSHGSNHLTDNNTVTYEAGKQSNAAKFTYTNTEYLSRAGASLSGFDDIGDFSMAFWIKVPTDLGRYPCIFSIDDASSQRKILLYYDDRGATTYLNFTVFGASYSYPNDYHQKQVSIPLTSTFKLIIIQYDISTDTLTAYVNNDAGTAFSHLDGNGVTSATLKNTTTTPLQIGYVGHAQALDGSIDEFGFWGRLLTSDERTELYASGAGLSYADTASGAVTITPSTQAASFSLPTRTIKSGVTKPVATQSATFSVPAHAISIAKTFIHSTLSAVFSIPVYTVDAGGNVTKVVNTQSATFSVPTYTASATKVVRIFANTASATFSVVGYTVSIVMNVLITASTQVLTFSLVTLQKVGAVWRRIGRANSGSGWTRQSRNSD